MGSRIRNKDKTVTRRHDGTVNSLGAGTSQFKREAGERQPDPPASRFPLSGDGRGEFRPIVDMRQVRVAKALAAGGPGKLAKPSQRI
jgi:hypothetical protein